MLFAVRRPSLLRRFLLLDGLVILVGAGLAVYADRPPEPEQLAYADAARELGGALVSGGLIAGMVLWFEERREDERVDREHKRDDRAAVRAWRREIDIRLVSLALTELVDGRHSQRECVDRRAAELADSPRTSAAIPYRSITDIEDESRPFTDVCAEFQTLIDFLRDLDLQNAWNSWSKAAEDNWNAIVEADNPVEPLETNRRLRAVEQSMWDNVLRSVTDYRDRHYPVESL